MMSVIFFGAEELGNVAAYLARDKWSAEGDLKRYSEQLAAYSVGNAAAYAYRYPNDAECAVPHKARVILAAAIACQEDHKASGERARSTIRLLSYNGPEGEGLEGYPGSLRYRKAMVSLLSRAYAYLLSEFETKEKGVGWEHGFGAGQD